MLLREKIGKKRGTIRIQCCFIHLCWLWETSVCCAVCLVTQSCLTLWDPMDCSLPGFSVHGILQARILEWVAISSSRGSSQQRDRTCISCVSEFFTHSTFREALWETSSSPKIIFHIAWAKHARKELCRTTEPV